MSCRADGASKARSELEGSRDDEANHRSSATAHPEDTLNDFFETLAFIWIIGEWRCGGTLSRNLEARFRATWC